MLQKRSFRLRPSLSWVTARSMTCGKPFTVRLTNSFSAGSLKQFSDFVDFLRTIRDPEKPNTLEDLKVVYEEGIFVQEPTEGNVYVVRIEFNPTVPHCSLATLIGLCIRIKVQRSLAHNLKLDIYIKKGAHSTEEESEWKIALNLEAFIVK